MITANVAETGWLNLLDAVVREQMFAGGTEVSFRRDDVVFAQGRNLQHVWLVVSGQLHMHMQMKPKEAQARFIHLIGPGFWIGDLEFLNQQQIGRTTIKAAEDTRLFRLRYTQLEAIAAEHPEVWRALSSLVADKCALAMDAGGELLIRDARERLAALMLRLAGHRGQQRVALPLAELVVGQTDLAQAANLSRSMVARLLSEFQDAGAIELYYRRIALRRIVLLEEIVA